MPKKKHNQKFIELLKTKIPLNLSPVDEVADLLNINYDAAYRRLNGKVSFDIEETIKLALHYDISLNNLYNVGEENTYLVKEGLPINSVADLEKFLERIYEELKILQNSEDAHITFASREIPMFYFFSDPILLKFKLYIWFYIQDTNPLKNNIPFKEFSIPDNLLTIAEKLRNLYNHINVTEIWNYSSLNNNLQQIIYFYKLRRFTLTEVENICTSITNELKILQESTLKHSHTKRKFELYNNDIVMNNNAILVENKGKYMLGLPYTLLNFFTITDPKISQNIKHY